MRNWISNDIATLYKQNFIPKQQLDTQEALVRQYEGIVKADQGQIDNAKLQLTYSSITAPIDGRSGCASWMRAISCMPTIPTDCW